jgi:hypothetical protein
MAKNSTIYQKRGNLNFKERKLISEINSAIEKNPDLASTIAPAIDFEELKQLHQKTVSDVVDFEEIVPEPVQKTAPIIDPLNRDEPNVRDYVMDDKFDPFADFQKSSKSNFSEPTNYSQAFDLPDEDEMRGGGQKREPNQRNQSQRPSQRSQPISSGDDSGKDKRRSKRFAKSVINTVCNLFEVGFVWYATKDINENKLAEYEVTGEIDVNALLSLPDGMEVTIKEFFLSQLGDIQVASKISKEKRDDLTESLTELFIEKNIQPSPNWEFALELGSVLAEQGIKLYMIANQNKQILDQLRERNAILKMEQEPQAPPPQDYSFEKEAPSVKVATERVARERYRTPSRSFEPKNYKHRSETPEYRSNLQKARAQQEANRDDKLKQRLFDNDPNPDTIARASDSVLMDMDEDIENELSLLESIETKE